MDSEAGAGVEEAAAPVSVGGELRGAVLGPRAGALRDALAAAAAVGGALWRPLAFATVREFLRLTVHSPLDTPLGDLDSCWELEECLSTLRAAAAAVPGAGGSHLRHAGDAARLLRRCGRADLAKRLGLLSRRRHAAAHPDPSLPAALLQWAAEAGGGIEATTAEEQEEGEALVAAKEHVCDDSGCDGSPSDRTLLGDSLSDFDGDDDGSGSADDAAIGSEKVVSFDSLIPFPLLGKPAFATWVAEAARKDEEFEELIFAALGAVRCSVSTDDQPASAAESAQADQPPDPVAVPGDGEYVLRSAGPDFESMPGPAPADEAALAAAPAGEGEGEPIVGKVGALEQPPDELVVGEVAAPEPVDHTELAHLEDTRALVVACRSQLDAQTELCIGKSNDGLLPLYRSIIGEIALRLVGSDFYSEGDRVLREFRDEVFEAYTLAIVVSGP